MTSIPNQKFKISRRGMLGAAGLLMVNSGLPRWFVEETLDAAEVEAPKSANDKPSIALIGCGGRGRSDAKDASKFGNIVAVCDVDRHHAEGAALDFVGAKPYHDFRELLDRDDIHIVVNGTPDHWHTLVNLHALHKGKDVYGEKPLTLTIDEGNHVVEAVEKTGRILQTGTQQRSDPNFRLACELVRNGRLGKLKEVTAFVPAGLRDGPFAVRPVPEHFDFDFWLGQAPKVDYVPQRTHANFRYWYDYSGGTMTDWGAHHNDIARWGIGLDGPTAIEAKPLAQPIAGGYTAYSEFAVEYTYADGIIHHCRSTTADTGYGAVIDHSPTAQHHGIKFEGTEGWIFVTRGKIEASQPELLTTPLPSDAQRLDVSNDHMGNFFECVRTRKQPIAPAAGGHRSASVCHLGVIALRVGRKLKWDPAAQQFIGDEEAQKFVARQMRDPWSYAAV